MPTSEKILDGIACGHTNRDIDHSTVFRVARAMSQIGYSIVAMVFGAAHVMAAPLFDDSAVLDVTLIGPIGRLSDDKENNGELAFVLEADGVRHQIDVRLRGQSRLRTCDFAPLRLDFRTSETAETIFAGQDKLKLVTHCRHNDQGEQDLLEEYAAYRIFNVLTDASYRVRLLRINYADTDGQLNAKSELRYAFLVEPAKQLAGRIGATQVNLRGLPKRRHDVAGAALIYVFQYLIGNTDWGFVRADSDDSCCHNGDLYERDSRVLVVPYDFDLSGLVNARYAFPDPSLRIDRVRQRLYRGLCTDREVLQTALRKIKSNEAGILAVLQDIPGLSADSIETAEAFLISFFKAAEDEDKLLSSFERRCS
ncbi:MAG: hypothetical protein OEM85_15045 [Gammaproteobacteria bacterium]|nr:hypothetical protein [Gammaproteobacteria bacterium]